MSRSSTDLECAPDAVRALEDQAISIFVDGVKLVGLPPSVGEIYGFLYISRQPQALDEIVSRLSMSKGSVSQGLKMLRSLGAISETAKEGERRTFYTAEASLKSLVGGFLREQVQPHLESGESKLAALREAASDLGSSEEAEFYQDRTKRLDGWFRRSKMLLPLIRRFVGKK